uniref:Cytoplasmic tRNA 2-thiolation protein 2 n=1 Tax=Mesocestoides corti TaxID=53468 RepID=A0A5K3G0Y2_MESCO
MSVPDGLVSISGRSNVTNCIKCKGVNGVPAVFIRKDDPPLCKTCFLSGCVHKFRSAFGKANIVRNRDAVALAFSGGASSLAMLQLAKMCHSTSQARKLRFQPTVICLYDVGQPYPHKQEEAMKVVGFDYRIVRTDEIPLDKNEGDFVDQLSASTALTNSALTAAEETLRWRRLKQLVLYTSRSLGHRFLLVGDNASQLAAQCLAGIAQGRGGSVAAELDFADTRFTDVTILRPMFNFLANEVVLFLRYAGLDAVIEPTLSLEQTLARGPGVNSIQRLTQDFISSLQFAGFPSTTKAVLR